MTDESNLTAEELDRMARRARELMRSQVVRPGSIIVAPPGTRLPASVRPAGENFLLDGAEPFEVREDMAVPPGEVILLPPLPPVMTAQISLAMSADRFQFIDDWAMSRGRSMCTFERPPLFYSLLGCKRPGGS